MGCYVGAASPSLAACNATCAAAKGCTFTFGRASWGMCGSCPNRWLDPTTLKSTVLPGAEPFWPPGFSIPGCTSCDDVKDECMLGCALAFNPALNPLPPSPSPPPDVPEPPAPWPNMADGFNFSVVLSSGAVLQRAPAAAAVFGPLGSADVTAAVSVTVTPSVGGAYSVPATIAGGRWKALLRPTAMNASVTYTIVATRSCTGGGCAATISIDDVLFGDVWYCFGQSNMWLQLQYTYARDATIAKIATGALDNIRIASGDSQSQGLSPSLPPAHPWRHAQDAAALPAHDIDSLDQFSAPCLHFAEAITDQHVAAGLAPPTLGLVATAIGGSMFVATNGSSLRESRDSNPKPLRAEQD